MADGKARADRPGEIPAFSIIMVIPTAACCDSDCSPTVTSGPPGNPGAAGAAGTNGTDGQNAYTSAANKNPDPQPVMPYPIQHLSTTLTIGSPTATLADTSTLAEGMTVEGTGITAGTTILSVDNATTITLSLNATANGAQTLTFKDFVTVDTTSSTAFMAIGEAVFLQFWGILFVSALPSATSVTVTNPTDSSTSAYSGNAAAGTSLPYLARIVPGGLQGPTGVTAGGALLAANKLSDLPAPLSDSRSNLGLGTVATFTQGNANGNVAKVDDGSGLTNGEAVFATASGIESKTAATARTALGLALGTNVQAYDALLAAIAALVTAADKIIYTTGIDTVALTDLTLTSRGLLAQTSTVAWRDVLGGVKLGYGIIGGVNGFDVNSAGNEETIPVSTYFGSSAARYRIDKIMIVDKSGAASLTTATLGVFSATGGGGTTLAADQALSSITAATKFVDLALQTLCGTDALTIPTLYVRCGTPQGAAALVDVYVWGWALNLV